jgi:hypothetical protein
MRKLHAQGKIRDWKTTAKFYSNLEQVYSAYAKTIDMVAYSRILNPVSVACKVKKSSSNYCSAGVQQPPFQAQRKLSERVCCLAKQEEGLFVSSPVYPMSDKPVLWPVKCLNIMCETVVGSHNSTLPHELPHHYHCQAHVTHRADSFHPGCISALYSMLHKGTPECYQIRPTYQECCKTPKPKKKRKKNPQQQRPVLWKAVKKEDSTYPPSSSPRATTTVIEIVWSSYSFFLLVTKDTRPMHCLPDFPFSTFRFLLAWWKEEALSVWWFSLLEHQ